MPPRSKNRDVDEALDLLASEIREEIVRIRADGAGAMQKGDYETAQSVIDFATRLESFAGKVEGLVEEWGRLAEKHATETPEVQVIVRKRFFGKARKGTITTHEDFYVPLLAALVKLGGEARIHDAIDCVGELMNGKLKPADFEELKTGMVRWRNKVMWARNNLVNELEYMRNDTPRGVWGISEKGRQWLRNQMGR